MKARYLKMMRRAIPPLAAMLVLQAARPALAELVTWTDKDGVVHVEGGPVRKASRKDAGAASLEGRQATGRSSVPSWQKPNLPPRTSPKLAVTAAKAGASARKKSGWWVRRSDAPPDQIDRAADLYKIPAELIRAVIAVESAGKAEAVSNKGAVGLMQLMPRTAGDMYVQDPVDPAQNVLGGTRYLRYLANQFGGDMVLTLAAYNAGPEAVRKYGGVPPFAETRDYVRKVTAHYFQLKKQAGGKKLAQAESGKIPGAAGGMP